jgi:hypothetical protein
MRGPKIAPHIGGCVVCAASRTTGYVVVNLNSQRGRIFPKEILGSSNHQLTSLLDDDSAEQVSCRRNRRDPPSGHQNRIGWRRSERGFRTPHNTVQARRFPPRPFRITNDSSEIRL